MLLHKPLSWPRAGRHARSERRHTSALMLHAGLKRVFGLPPPRHGLSSDRQIGSRRVGLFARGLERAGRDLSVKNDQGRGYRGSTPTWRSHRCAHVRASQPVCRRRGTVYVHKGPGRDPGEVAAGCRARRAL